MSNLPYKIVEEYRRKSDKHAWPTKRLRLWRGKVHKGHL